MLSCVRVQKIRDLGELARAQSHGRRLDPSAQSRVDPGITCNNLYMSAYADCPSDLVGAWQALIDSQGATTYSRAPIALHLIAVVSPAWVSETGNPHSHENPRNLMLFAEAQTWARLTFGDDALFAARMDMDEEGAGVVDLFVAPIAQVRINRSAPA